MARPPSIEFLDRGSYRQRRFRDAVRVMPLLAAILMLLPLMWPREVPEEGLTSNGFIYLFTIWLILIAAAAFFARVLRPPMHNGGEVPSDPQDEDAGP